VLLCEVDVPKGFIDGQVELVARVVVNRSIKCLLLKHFCSDPFPNDLLRLSPQLFHLFIDNKLLNWKFNLDIQLLVELQLFRVPQQYHLKVSLFDEVDVLLYFVDGLVGL
jgi:hypothetical protein